ncbi:MAG TPA: cupin domain-containing protein [Streptosporangiaceae bacterium]
MTPRPPLARRLDLQPHPEGGWYRQTWRSPVSFEPAGYGGPRRAATAIYFLLQPGERSRWHVVRSDELWLWHSGGPLELRTGGSGPAPSGAGHPVLLGGDLTAWQQPQVVIPGGTWQCAEPAGQQPVLVSCVVAPGFEFDDFRLADAGPDATGAGPPPA